MNLETEHQDVGDLSEVTLAGATSDLPVAAPNTVLPAFTVWDLSSIEAHQRVAGATGTVILQDAAGVVYGAVEVTGIGSFRSDRQPGGRIGRQIRVGGADLSVKLSMVNAAGLPSVRAAATLKQVIPDPVIQASYIANP